MILVSGLVFSQRDVDIGPAQLSRDILGVDLERLVEEPYGAVLIATTAEHVALDLQSFGRAGVGGDHFVDQLVGLGWFLPLNSRASCILGSRRWDRA